MMQRFEPKTIKILSAPTATAVLSNGVAYFSGVVALDPDRGEMRFGTIEEETRIVIERMQRMLAELGKDLSHVTMTEVFLSTMDDFDGFNRVYAEYFEHLPCPAARRTLGAQLWSQCKIEISFFADLSE